jgi:hypothetical protein
VRDFRLSNDPHLRRKNKIAGVQRKLAKVAEGNGHDRRCDVTENL